MPSVEDWKNKYAALQAKYDTLARQHQNLVDFVNDFRYLATQSPIIPGPEDMDWDELRNYRHEREVRFAGYGK